MALRFQSDSLQNCRAESCREYSVILTDSQELKFFSSGLYVWVVVSLENGLLFNDKKEKWWASVVKGGWSAIESV